MRVDPQLIVDDWEAVTQGELIEQEPGYVRAAREDLARRREIEDQHWFDLKVDEVQHVLAAAAQMELQLPEMNERAHAREVFSDFLERVVLPATDSRSIHRIPATLRTVRKRCDRWVLPATGKQISRWDAKAGMPLLCPDDARDEANRIKRRYVPVIVEAVKRGCSVHFCVFTIDNPPPGKLRLGIHKLHRKQRSIWRACKGRDRPFPIIGGISVLEAPLGGYRDWHPHLNVILICDGYLDYEKLRARWGCNAHFEPISTSRKPASQAKVKAAVRELIKYAVQTVPEKSIAKAAATARYPTESDRSFSAGRRDAGGRDPLDRKTVLPDRSAVLARSDAGHAGRANHAQSADVLLDAALCDQLGVPGRAAGARPRPPAMTEWTAAEWIEWWNAHRGLRRTRTFGCLFKAPKPEKLDTAGAIHTHSDVYDHQHRRFVRRSPLLESIPGDKSTPEKIVESWKAAWMKLLGPPDHLARVCDARRTIEKHYGPVSLAIS